MILLLKLILSGLIMSPFNDQESMALPATECIISGMYQGVTPALGSKCVTGFDEIEDVSLILVPTKIDNGTYEGRLSRSANNLYQLVGSDIYIETNYCYEYSYYKDAIIIIKNNYGFVSGKIIFD